MNSTGKFLKKSQEVLIETYWNVNSCRPDWGA